MAMFSTVTSQQEVSKKVWCLGPACFLCLREHEANWVLYIVHRRECVREWLSCLSTRPNDKLVTCSGRTPAFNSWDGLQANIVILSVGEVVI